MTDIAPHNTRWRIEWYPKRVYVTSKTPNVKVLKCKPVRTFGRVSVECCCCGDSDWATDEYNGKHIRVCKNCMWQEELP